MMKMSSILQKIVIEAPLMCKLITENFGTRKTLVQLKITIVQ